MKTNREKVTQWLEDHMMDPDEVQIELFECSSYEGALVGITDDNRAVYSYDKMIESLMRDDNMTYDEAVEWIDFNTIGSLVGKTDGPIIMYTDLYD